MKIGRNDPCPCGSGKKYKQCCMNKENRPVDLLWYRLSGAHDKLIDQLMDYSEDRMGPMALLFAIGEFLLWPEEDEDIYDLIDDHMQLFLPWYLFNWLYDPDDAEEMEVEIDLSPDKTIAETYLAEHRSLLDDLQIRLIQATVHVPYSFYEVMAFEPGHSLTLKDVLTGEQTKVMEATASEMLQIGDILLGRIVTVDHVSILMGLSSIAIRPSFKSQIIHLRNQIRKMDGPVIQKVLQIHSYDIRDLYLRLYNAMTQPFELTNSAGEPLLFHTLKFKIEDPHDAFQKLQSLAGDQDSLESATQKADFDADHRIEKIIFPWFDKDAQGQDTVFGQITIDHDALLVEVNSALRAEQIQSEIESRLGSSAQYLETQTHDPETLWPEEGEDWPDQEAFQEDLDTMAEDPQSLAYLQQVISDHWHGWIDEKLPALGGKTPRQAARTEDGREAIEAILLEARRPLVHDGMLDKFDTDPIEDVRRRLGMHKPLKNKDGGDNLEKQRKAFETIDNIIIESIGSLLDSRLLELARQLCRRLAAGDEFSLDRGKPQNWAAAIAYVIADLNFLFDPDSDLYLSKEKLCGAFNVKPRTASDKARNIRYMCDIDLADSRFTLPEIAARFSFVETPEGFVLPVDMADDYPSGRSRNSVKTEPPAKKNHKTKDDGQLNLFDDE